ncbi:MAG: rhomboid family intramembrane serine protease [Sphingobium sp.]|nr:rhomboid family intramembrane serine protease [Sphingobium sp.]
MTLPRGRMTDAIAGVTFLAFLLAAIAGPTLTGVDVAIFGGFIPARVHAFAAHNVVLHVNWLPVWLTPLSATLIHGGWMHVALNLIIFLYCGRFVEHLLGGGRLLILYVIGAYASAFAQWLAAPASPEPMIGASGAISAVIGTYALIFSQREVKPIGPIPASVVRILWMAAGWTILQLMIALAGLSGGLLGGIAIWAHIGGFVAGLVLARPLLLWRFKAR